MSDVNFKYWAFVAFNAGDNSEQRAEAPGVLHLRWGDWLLAGLKDFSTPPDFAGHPNARSEIVPERIAEIFSHSAELSEGESLSGEMSQALEHSRYLVVICSPRSAKSRGVDEVVRRFKQLGRGNRILSIVIAGEPHTQIASQPGLWVDDECFSPALRHPVLPDGTLDTNRLERGYIFADARHGDDKREVLAKDFQTAESVLERAKIQLIAGLIGVGFNNLWQREQKRRFAGFADAQNQIHAAWQETRKAKAEAEAGREQLQRLQSEARAAQEKYQDAERQLQEVREQVREAQKRVLEIQNLAPDVKSQIEDAQNQLQASQRQVQELQQRVREAEARAEEARNQARDAEKKLHEMQERSRDAAIQIETARREAGAAQGELQKIQSQSRESLGQQESHAKKIRETESELRSYKNELEKSRQKTRAAQRLTKVFAVLAALAALAAGIVWAQKKNSAPSPPVAGPIATVEATNDILNSEKIRSTLLAAKDAKPARDLETLTTRLAPEHFAETFQLAADILDDPQREAFQRGVLDAWMQTNAPAAFAWSQQLTNAAARGFALKTIVPAMAADATNAQTAFAWLKTETNFSAAPTALWRASLLTNFFAAWAKKDLDAGTLAAAQLPVGATKDATEQILFSERIAQAPASAAAMATNLPNGDFRREALNDISRRWAVSDASNALAWAKHLPAEHERSNAVSQIVHTWAKYDFAATTNWIASETNELLAAQLALAEPWAEKDARDLATNALALPAGEVQKQWLSAACRQLATKDFSAVGEMLQPLTDAELRRTLLEQTARELDLRQAEAAGNAIIAMPPGDTQQAAINGLLSRWATNDVVAALTWLNTFPETNAQPTAAAATLKTWAQREPAAAAAWLTHSPSGATNEIFISALLDGAVVNYPEFAAQWTQSLTNESTRQKFQAQVLQKWSETDADKARKWAEAAGLPVK